MKGRVVAELGLSDAAFSKKSVTRSFKFIDVRVISKQEVNTTFKHMADDLAALMEDSLEKRLQMCPESACTMLLIDFGKVDFQRLVAISVPGNQAVKVDEEWKAHLMKGIDEGI